MKEDRIKTLLQASKSAGPLTVGFLLVPNFSMLAFASALEPLRAANRMSGQNLFSWVISSPSGAAPEASNGVRVDV
ncbi:MAG: GlxA family transcriptional regulator, partial [Candidatus Puniceispirillaceae bacterium]